MTASFCGRLEVSDDGVVQGVTFAGICCCAACDEVGVVRLPPAGPGGRLEEERGQGAGAVAWLFFLTRTQERGNGREDAVVT